MMDTRDETNRNPDPREARLARQGVIESSDLFAERNEVQIHHDGEVYRLRLTKNGKLILNK
ncbi:MAG: hemin uptake protein HemP [Phycisphaerae bacterium]